MKPAASTTWVEGPLRVWKSIFCGQNHHSFDSVVCFTINSLSMATAGGIWCIHLPDGGIQWLLVKLGMCSIRQCTLHRTTAFAWWSISLAIWLHFSSSSTFFSYTTVDNDCVMVDPSYHIIYIIVMILFVYHRCLLMRMDAVSATIVDDGQVICRKH